MKQKIINLALLSLFFEGYIFSFYVFGARVRISQVIMSLGLTVLFSGVLIHKVRIKWSRLDTLMWAFIGINFVSIVNALLFRRALKIALLLFSLLLMYFLFRQFINTKKMFYKSFSVFLWVGMLQIVYGLYQVVAGILIQLTGFVVPVGHLGVTHRDYIGAFWGRPYGTFVEPDWYGNICMFYAFVFISLYYSKLQEKKAFYLCGMILSLLGLFFSFVRSAWLGFIAGAFIMLVYNYRSRFTKISLKLYARNLVILGGILVVVILWVNPVRVVLMERINPSDTTARFDTNNIRLVSMCNAFKAFMMHPILGNGPGSSAVTSYYLATGRTKLDQLQERGYNGNLPLTVLEDTGIIGMFLFLVLVYHIVIYNIRIIPNLEPYFSVSALGLFAGLTGLFVSYLFSHGFWIPFTWVFLAFNIITLRLGRSETV